MTKIKVGFIFSGRNRKDAIKDISNGLATDSLLRGANYLDRDIDVEIIDILCDYKFAKFIEKYFGQKFVYFLYHKKCRQFDFVITSSAEIYFLYFKFTNFFRKNNIKTIYIALTINTLLKKYSKNPIKRYVLKKILLSFDKIICISKKQVENLINLGIFDEKIEYILHGIDTKFYKNSNSNFKNDYILSVGRDMGIDYETLLKIADRIKHKIVIVASQKNIPINIKIPENVEIKYNITEVELRNLYQNSNIMVVPSLSDDIDIGSDCSGQTVIVEAMSDKKAVIATEKSWINDYFENNKDIILVKSGDAYSLANSVNNLLDDNHKIKILGDNAYRKVTSIYSTEIFGKNLSKIIKKVI